ncbi:MAG: SBBP repeat-containing protein, partial [Bacteroidota bacterium]|nr:SBBP repeat-containing protein [Bacteroidota bacterium]MDX5430140.1 SBBP repeat-containing protein [Bacteroidota bacterium]MDX5468901.1 SBBP repeat-containing protein [Bacteroidota bacterium]
FNHFVEEAPEAYQLVGGEKVKVDCRFVLEGQVLSYALGDYNPDLDLIIDPPILIFVTYSGSSVDNFGFTATYDSKGCLYAGGNVTSPFDIAPNGRYPATPGAFQVNAAGFLNSSGPDSHFPCDMGISKYDSSGKTLMWATYLGGTNNDYPHSLVVDHEDRLVIMGSTYSKDFPVDTAAFDTVHGGQADIVVVKFSWDGSALLGSTYVGGTRNEGVLVGPLVYNYADNYRGDVQINREGHIFVASCTNSSTEVPVTADALSSSLNGGYDGLIFEMDSSLQNMLWCTYWGGKEDDALYSVRIDRSRNLIFGGGTQSDSIFISDGAFDSTFNGGTDGMVLRIDQSTKTVLASTYLGTSSYDQVHFVDFDLKNHVYAYGQTEGVFPLLGSPYSFPQGGQFIVKMDEGLDSLLMSTTLGARAR